MEIHEWKELYLPLFSYADQLLKNSHWFRGKGVNSYIKGRQAHDYVLDAIELYTRHPEKFDPLRNSNLLNYLKFNLIRRAVWNDYKCSENKKMRPELIQTYSGDDDDEKSIIEEMGPHVEATIESDIDLQTIFKEIETEIKDDPVLLEIFDGICRKGLKRREVIEDYDIQPKDFDNGFKRLKTILKKTALKYNLTKTE